VVRLIRSELTWIASTCVVALLASRFASRTGVAIGLLVIAVAALWIGRGRRTRVLAELRAKAGLLEAAVADREVAERILAAMAAELAAARAAAAEREAEIERALAEAAERSGRPADVDLPGDNPSQGAAILGCRREDVAKLGTKGVVELGVVR